jgi:hypothetical protein
MDRGRHVLINGSTPPRPAWRVQAGDELRVRVADLPKRARPQARRSISTSSTKTTTCSRSTSLRAWSCTVVRQPVGNADERAARSRAIVAGGSKPALLGRLDKHTSGVVLVTKRSEIHAALQRAMNARRIDKDYLAIVAASRRSAARSTWRSIAIRGIAAG